MQVKTLAVLVWIVSASAVAAQPANERTIPKRVLVAPARADYTMEPVPLELGVGFHDHESALNLAATELIDQAGGAGAGSRRLSDDELRTPSEETTWDPARLIQRLQTTNQRDGLLLVLSVSERDGWGLLTSSGENMVKLEVWSLETGDLVFCDGVYDKGSANTFRDRSGALTQRGRDSIGQAAQQLAESVAGAVTADGGVLRDVAVKDPLQSEWEDYTARYIAHFRLDELQSKRAWRFCETAQKRARPLAGRISRTSRDSLQKDQNGPSSSSEQNPKRRRAILAQIDKVFDSQLSDKLDELPTGGQRSHATGTVKKPRSASDLFE